MAVLGVSALADQKKTGTRHGLAPELTVLEPMRNSSLHLKRSLPQPVGELIHPATVIIHIVKDPVNTMTVLLVKCMITFANFSHVGIHLPTSRLPGLKVAEVAFAILGQAHHVDDALRH